MSEIDYIGADELVFNNDKENGIHSGGFSVKSIMMKAGMSPILTVNYDKMSGGGDNVSDLFNDLVVPNWVLSYNTKMIGGNHDNVYHNQTKMDDEEEVMEEDLHEKLLALVNSSDKNTTTVIKKRKTRKMMKSTTRNKQTKRKK